MRDESSPPTIHQAPDVERAVLAAAMLDKRALDEVVDIMTPEAFFFLPHRRIWEAIAHLAAHGQPVDLLTVSCELEARGYLLSCGGRAELVKIADSVWTGVNARSHAGILLKHQKRRALDTLLREGMGDLCDDPDEVLSLLEGKLQCVAEIGSATHTSIDDQINQMIASDLEVMSGRLSGFNWPIRELTTITRGIRPGRIYLLVALFKTGKSKFAIATIHRLIQENVPVLFLSLEMGPTQVFHWLAGNSLLINTEFYGSPRLSRSQMQDTHQWVKEHCTSGQLTIDARGMQTPTSICRAIRQAVSSRGIKVVFIDYLQRVKWGSSSNHLQDIAVGLNLIVSTAKGLGVAVVGLSQVPKAVEFRGSKDLVNIADVKDASSYAEVADVCIGITDPHRHKPSAAPQRDLKFLIEQRDGPTKVLDIRADLRFGHFESFVKTGPTAESVEQISATAEGALA